MDNRSESLDLMRGIAALFVMIGHIRGIFFAPFGELTNANSFDKAFYFLTGYGHQCVIIFFVLSGYFVGSALHRGFQTLTPGNNISNYSINRIVRLWVVLIPALALTLILDQVGLALATDKSIYTTNNYFEFIPLSNDRGIVAFLGNLFFLQTIEVPTFGTNGPLWSLANEFWYYLLFPMLYVLFLRQISVSKKLIVAALFVLIMSWLAMRNMSLAMSFVIWLAGFGAYLISTRPHWIIRVISIFLFIATMIVVRLRDLPFEEMILGAATTLLVISVRDLRLSRFRVVADFLSRISYTLYLIHMPIVVFLSATIFYGRALTTDVTSMLIFAGLVLGIIGVSYLFYLMFEGNTDRVRRYVKDFFKSKKLASQS